MSTVASDAKSSSAAGDTKASTPKPQFSVASFNVLAQEYAQNASLGYCNKEALRWCVRSVLIKAEYKNSNADILALQEVRPPSVVRPVRWSPLTAQVDKYDDFHEPVLRELG